MGKIHIFFEEIQKIKISKRELTHFLNEMLHHESLEMGEISLIFCSDAYLLHMNMEFLNHDYYTDIITFNYRENENISGDLFISLDRIRENAGQLNVAFEKELYRVIFHGILHLVGYDDKDEEMKKQMRNKEDFYLQMFEIH